MRIALTFPGCHRRGGVERVMLECVNFLASREHETHAFATQWDADGVRREVIRHQVSAPSLLPLLAVPAFARACRRQIASLPAAPQVVAGFGAAASPGSVVWMQSVHAAWIEISRRTRGSLGRLKQRLNLFHPVILRLERELIGGRRYRKIIALTETVRADILRHYAVPAEDIVVIPNGFAPEEFSVARVREKRAQMRQRLGYGDRDQVILFVANELERKGFRPLLEAVARLDDPTLRLLAVGRLDAASCANSIRALGLEGRVQFCGPTNDVADYFAAADCFALPTQYEAWGLVIVEALACGLPVLTSRLAGAAMVVHEGKTGELLDDPLDPVEIAQKLARLLHERGATSEVIAQSVLPYRWREVLARYEKTLVENAG